MAALLSVPWFLGQWRRFQPYYSLREFNAPEPANAPEAQ
jgi:hypothetical protein